MVNFTHSLYLKIKLNVLQTIYWRYEFLRIVPFLIGKKFGRASPVNSVQQIHLCNYSYLFAMLCNWYIMSLLTANDADVNRRDVLFPKKDSLILIGQLIRTKFRVFLWHMRNKTPCTYFSSEFRIYSFAYFLPVLDIPRDLFAGSPLVPINFPGFSKWPRINSAKWPRASAKEQTGCRWAWRSSLQLVSRRIAFLNPCTQVRFEPT